MKKVLFTFSLMLAFAFTFNTVLAQSGAAIKFDSEVIDYGTIDQYSDGFREFVFTNTGNEPLIISNAKGSCGCTVPTWPKDPILPGAQGVIKVKYATDRIGVFSKNVTIESNAVNAGSKRLEIKGNVLAKPQGSAPVNNAGAPSK